MRLQKCQAISQRQLLLLSVILILCLCHSTLAKKSKQKLGLPFEEQHKDTHILKDENGDLTIRLLKQKSESSLRNIPIAKDLRVRNHNNIIQGLTDYLFGNEDIVGWQEFIQSHKAATKKKNNEHKLKSDQNINFSNLYNFLYYGPVYMGTSAKEMQVVYDTGSDWLVIESKDCRTCYGSNYDTSTSTSYTKATALASYHYYGSSGLMGFNSTDDVYLDSGKTTGVGSFLWFLVLDQYGIGPDSDGILGLCRNYQSSTYASGPLFIENLFNNGKLSNKLFAFYLANEETQSFIQIGTYSESYMKDPSSLVWIDCPMNFYWTSYTTGFKYGSASGTLFDNTYSIDSYPAVFDSGSSLIYVPKTISVNFISQILKGKQYSYYTEYGMYLVSCDSIEFETVSIYIDGYWFAVHPSTYIVSVQDDPPICALGFVANGDDNFILGNVFLRNYYAIFDMENNRIGLTPHLTSSIQSSDLIGDPPSIKLFSLSKNYYKSMGTTANFMAPILLVAVVAYIVSQCCFSSSNVNDNDDQDPCCMCCYSCCCYVCCCGGLFFSKAKRRAIKKVQRKIIKSKITQKKADEAKIILIM